MNENMSLVLLSEAKSDIERAYLWYEEQALGLGMEFLRCVETAFTAIQRNPMTYRVIHRTYRQTLVRRFPFAVIFDVEEKEKRCVVYSVFHCSQDPERWRERLAP